MSLATALPETRSRLVTLDPRVVSHWSHQLGEVVEKVARIDRRHGDAINDIRGRMDAVAQCNGVDIAAGEPLIWAGTLMLVAAKLARGDYSTALHHIGVECAHAAGLAVAK